MSFRNAFSRAPADRRCARCRHFVDDRGAIESELPGLLVLSSAFGDSLGDAGLCRRHDLLLLPFHDCVDFAVRPALSETPIPPAE